ncbi:30S ribosomal protein S2 [Candidatus Pacearchaeota archaeon]|nr:30S ribosomal protein S2 [Candidatus Pacearchaeota archaeon]
MQKKKTTLEKVEKKVKKVSKQITEEVKDIAEKVVGEAKEVEEKLTKEEKKSARNSEADSKEDKLAALKEKAAKLAKKVEEKEISLHKKEKSENEKTTLAPIEDYLKSSMHLGTRAITPDMKSFVYKRRADSLAVFDTELLDKKLTECADYMSKFPPEEIIIVCKREAGLKAVELFSKTLGIKSFIKNYPAGILTNPNLDNFMEAEMLFICDPWTDRAAFEDAKRIKIPVMAICDTNNYTRGITQILPGNNKSAKSLGFILYIVAKLYAEKRKLKTTVPTISEWVENWDSLVPPK